MSEEEKKRSQFISDLLKVFLVPTLVNKVLMLYFGIHYAKYPGDGYGYGLIASIAFLIFTVIRFLWKYRHESDP